MDSYFFRSEADQMQLILDSTQLSHISNLDLLLCPTVLVSRDRYGLDYRIEMEPKCFSLSRSNRSRILFLKFLTEPVRQWSHILFTLG